MSFEILHRYTSAVLFKSDTATNIKEVTEEAYLRGANLDGAYLRGAYLRGAKGLLPNSIVPLQIGGSRDWIIVRKPGFITIGCEHHEIEWWEEHYKAVGQYAEHIAYCKSWMEKRGIDKLGKETQS